MNGLSKWTYEGKRSSKKDGITYIESKPIICDCGKSIPIGGNGGLQASFFYIDFEWICIGCGMVLEPILDKEKR